MGFVDKYFKCEAFPEIVNEEVWMKKLNRSIRNLLGVAFICLSLSCSEKSITNSTPDPPPPTTGILKIENLTNDINIGWIYLDGGNNHLGATAWVYPGNSWEITLSIGTHSFVIRGDSPPYDGMADKEWTGTVSIKGGTKTSIKIYGG